MDSKYFAYKVVFDFDKYSSANYNFSVNYKKLGGNDIPILLDPTIDGCGILDTPNTVYTLNASVSSDGTCFNIFASNVTLDCNGYTINYSSLSVGYGVYSNSSNTTIENCIIEQAPALLDGSFGIKIQGDNATILSNYITTRGDNWGHGIYLASNYNNLTNNIVSSNGKGGQSTQAHALYLYGSSNGTFTNNSFTANQPDSYGAYFDGVSSDNIFIDGRIYSTDSSLSPYGVYITDTSENNLFRNVDIYAYITEKNIRQTATAINNFTNCTFNKSQVSITSGSINVFWYADTYVNDTSSNPLNLVNVSIIDVNSNFINWSLTNSSGFINQLTLREYMQNATAMYFDTNYTFLGNKTDYAGDIEYVNLTSNAIDGDLGKVILTLTEEGDSTPPYFTVIPSNLTLEYGNLINSGVFEFDDDTGIDSIWINWTDYFTMNDSDAIINSSFVPAGVYEINVSINDTSGNTNETAYRITVSQNTEDCGIWLNESSPIIYSSQIIVYTNCTSDYSLLINNTATTNASTHSLGAGLWNFSVFRTDTANYSNIYNEEEFVINKISPDLHLYLNGTESNKNYNIPNLVNGTITKITLEGTSELIINGTVVTLSTDMFLSNLTYYEATDYRNYTARFNSTENYTEQTITYFASLREAIGVGMCELDVGWSQTKEEPYVTMGECLYE
jgi:hypothetical protein